MIIYRYDPAREKIVYGSVFIAMTAIISIIHSLGTLFPFFLEEFGESRAKTAAVQSTFIGVGLCSSLVVGMAVQHYGPRTCGIIGGAMFSLGLILSAFATSVTYLILTLGILSGLGGLAFFFLSACQAAGQCFDGKAKLVAIAVVTSSIGVGAMGYPYLFKISIEHFGVKGTLLLLGGVTMNAIPLAILWSPPRNRHITKHADRPEGAEQQVPLIEKKSAVVCTSEAASSIIHKRSENEEPLHYHMVISTNMPDDKNTECKCSRAAANTYTPTIVDRKPGGMFAVFLPTITYKPFFALVCCFACAVPSVNMFEILLLDVLETTGLSRERCITLFIILNCLAIPGRIFPGLVNRIPRCSSGMAPILGAGISGVASCLLILTSGYVGNVISCVLLGLSKGILLGSVSVVSLEMLSSARLSTAMGIIACVIGVITSALGPLHGYLRDQSGSYTISLYIATASMLFALLFSCISMLLHSRMKTSKYQSNTLSLNTT